MSKAKPTPLTDPLRRALAECELPMLRIAADSGVDRASLIRFRDGERSLRLDMADRLAEYFGLQLVPRKRRAN
jgi:plasmid maintenance system antidote protein VapI